MSKDFKACTKWFLILAGAIIILMEIYVRRQGYVFRISKRIYRRKRQRD